MALYDFIIHEVIAVFILNITINATKPLVYMIFQMFHSHVWEITEGAFNMLPCVNQSKYASFFLNIQTIPLDPTNSNSSPTGRVSVPACAVIVQAVAGGELERCYSLEEPPMHTPMLMTGSSTITERNSTQIFSTSNGLSRPRQAQIL